MLKNLKKAFLGLFPCFLSVLGHAAPDEGKAIFSRPVTTLSGGQSVTLVAMHAETDKNALWKNALGHPATMAYPEYSGTGANPTSCSFTAEEASATLVARGLTHEALEKLRGPAFNPGTVEAAKPLHEAMTEVFGSPIFVYTKERVGVRVDGWTSANAGPYPRAFTIDVEGVPHGLFSFAVSSENIMDVFYVLNTELRRQGVLKGVIKTVVSYFEETVLPLLSGGVPVLRITHRADNAETPGALGRIFGESLGEPESKEAFGSVRQTYMISGAIEPLKAWVATGSAGK